MAEEILDADPDLDAPRAAARRGRGPPRRRRRVPLQELMTTPMRPGRARDPAYAGRAEAERETVGGDGERPGVAGDRGTARRARLVAPKGDGPPDDGPREGGGVLGARAARCRRRDRARPLRRERRARRSRRCRAARRARCSSTATSRRAARSAANLATTGFEDRGPGRAASTSARFLAGPPPPRPRSTWCSLDPPYDVPSDEVADGAGRASAAAAGSRRARRSWSSGPVGRTARRCRTGWGIDVGAGLRRYARGRRSTPADPRPSTDHRSNRVATALCPGSFDPGDPRPPRHHRAHRAALRRRHRRGHPQPAEGAVAVHPRGAPGDAGARRPRTSPTCGSSSSRACSSTSPRDHGAERDREGPAGRLRLRLRAADGADEPAAVGHRHLLHLDEPAALVPVVEPGAGGRASSAATCRAWCRPRSPTRLAERFVERERGDADGVERSARRTTSTPMRCLQLREHHRHRAHDADVGVGDGQPRRDRSSSSTTRSTALPEELRQARWLLKEREEFLAQARREAEDIIEAGRVQAERMVERTEVVREARRVAQQVIVDDAEADSRATARTRPRTTSTGSWRRSRSCSSARCRRWPRAASSSRPSSSRCPDARRPHRLETMTTSTNRAFFDQDDA